jgi:hypothetical protein
MIIELNTDLLNVEDNLSMNQLVFLSMILDKNQKPNNQDVRKLVSLISDDEISYLLNQDLITSIERDDAIVYEAGQKLTNFLNSKRGYFDQFYEQYPVYVLRPDGSKGYLRANVNKCRRMFDTICGKSSAMAEHLINCLDYEVKKKMSTGKIGYMKTMWRWLVDHQWEEIEEELKDTDKTVSAYGTDII